ncbi:hypothetical protein E2C01_067117 [Portunus trituberculatus]|uniref:Uncharacterized protein n=1 Tax=Portunus trituberculatus TaxID=210409 RepID=A0A5B7HRS7_PORTR|nr:hypothetical protein [Portunus trituberculatus]
MCRLKPIAPVDSRPRQPNSPRPAQPRPVRHRYLYPRLPVKINNENLLCAKGEVMTSARHRCCSARTPTARVQHETQHKTRHSKPSKSAECPAGERLSKSERAAAAAIEDPSGQTHLNQ